MAKTDKKTLELIETVKRERAEIAKLDRPSYKTNLSFTYIEGNRGSATNLNVETDVKKLILMAAFLTEKENSYKGAAKLLGVEKVPDFTWDGYTVAEWMQDIKTRIAKVQISAKKAKLETLEARLKKIISPELQAELELADIEADLKG